MSTNFDKSDYDIYHVQYDEEVYLYYSWISWGRFPYLIFTSKKIYWKNNKLEGWEAGYQWLKDKSREELFEHFHDMPQQGDIVAMLLDLQEFLK